jgi:hypothetical protein
MFHSVLVILCICRSTASGRGETWNLLWDAHEVGHSSRVVYRNSHQIAKYSKDFRVQWYPEYKRSNNIVPFVSLRDCKRAEHGLRGSVCGRAQFVLPCPANLRQETCGLGATGVACNNTADDIPPAAAVGGHDLRDPSHVITALNMSGDCAMTFISSKSPPNSDLIVLLQETHDKRP